MTQTNPGAARASDPWEASTSRGLNLYLELADRRRMPELLRDLEALRKDARQALTDLHFVHFARFLPLRDQSALLVVTEFDGPRDAYVLDFIVAVSHVFNAILKYVKDAPPLPVEEYPDAFMAFIRKYDTVLMAPNLPYFADPYPLYSAYPGLAVLDIVTKRPQPLAAYTDAAPQAIDFADVQGNILHGFRASRARHYALRVDQAAEGRRFLGLLVDGKEVPKLTSEQDWLAGHHSLEHFLTVGITSDGLQALGVPAKLRAQLPPAFREGPADPDRAACNGDRGESAPGQWRLGRPGEPVHLLVSVYAPGGTADAARREQVEQAFRAACAALESWWEAHGIAIAVTQETASLPLSRVHFGYVDGLSQPRIAGVRRPAGAQQDHDTGPDKQPLARPGDFLLGAAYEGVYGGSSLRSMPTPLCHNATFAAVRVMEQKVAAFEQFLQDQAQLHKVHPEWLAAKLVGRWRDSGTPLPSDIAAAQDPSTDEPASGREYKPGADYNDFDYAPSVRHPGVNEDDRGLICPVGAHMRRMNPRAALVAGAPYTHRLLRRGMPYGPAWAGQDDRVERGLFGIFLCADLERQFEFLLQQWAQGEPGARNAQTKDPLLAGGDSGVDFTIPVEGRPQGAITVHVPPLLTTRGGLYLLVPGLQGLRWLAEGKYFDQPDACAALPLVRNFDPMDPRFIEDPYPTYAKLRNDAPVAPVRHGKYESYWVFSHALVTQVCERADLFLKRPAGEPGARGLFFMDPPRHTQVRALLDPMFKDATSSSPGPGNARPGIADIARQEAQAVLETLPSAGAFDLIGDYSRRVTRNVFMRMFGVPEDHRDMVGAWIDAILELRGALRPDAVRKRAEEPSTRLALYFAQQQQLARCPVHAPEASLFGRMCQAGRDGELSDPELLQTAVHFALGGYLSTDFLVGTGIHNLLRTGTRDAFLALDGPGRRDAVEEMKRFDVPFQLADRFAATDVELGGCRIPAGARVTVVYGAANHDPAVFGPDADAFVPGRRPQPGNYVFGHGIHHCIGAPMASEVAPIAIEALLEARPTLALAQGAQAQRYDDPYFRGFRILPVQG